ncbi:MAG: DUF433 domain-containing protein [Thermoflexia bacterium]|nr:MAG: DUF433 domain-containing protein [Thermoflexia bacterium]
MNWQERIHSDPEILLGKPVVKGTRLSVDFILSLFAAGWTEEQVLENYPVLTREDLRAVFAFAADCMRTEAFYPVSVETI